MSIAAKLNLPREHGAWAMFLVPYLVGALGAGAFSPAVIWLGLAALLLFLSRGAVVQWLLATQRGRPPGAARTVALAYIFLAALSGLGILLTRPLSGLLPPILGALLFGIVHLIQSARHQERGVAGELVAVAGLTLLAPATRFAALGSWDRVALTQWAICVLFFASSIFYVKHRVAAARPWRGDDLRRLQRHTILYHLFLVALLAAGLWTTVLPPLAALAFLLPLGRAAWSLLRPHRRLVLIRVGVMEVVYSVAFLTLVAMAYG